VPYAPHAKGGLHLVDAIRQQACAVVGDIFVVLRFHKAWLKRRLATATKVLVLDLDETLIHNVEYGQDSFFLVRPGCVQFIELMAQYYEIVIFTAAL
jgi:TFIIF-interacting CTD phosphatase-like protein